MDARLAGMWQTPLGAMSDLSLGHLIAAAACEAAEDAGVTPAGMDAVRIRHVNIGRNPEPLAVVRAAGFREAMPMEDVLPFPCCDPTDLTTARRGVVAALDETVIGVDDLDLPELHDYRTTAECPFCETIDLAGNDNGGPVGAIGISMHVTGARPAIGTVEGTRAPAAQRTATCIKKGAGVAKLCSIPKAMA